MSKSIDQVTGPAAGNPRIPTCTPVAARACVRHFGLIDLVVLLTILAAVLAIILPVVYGAIEQAKSVACAGNLKKIITWTGMYTVENQNILPPYENGWVRVIAAKGGLTVAQDAAPTGDFACPSQPFSSPVARVSAADYWRGTNYGINQHLASSLRRPDGSAYPEWSSGNVRAFNDPSGKVVFADTAGSNYFGIPGRDPAVAGLSMEGRTFADAMLPNPAKPFPALRHLGGTANFLFVDGHTEIKDSFPPFMTGRGTGGYDFWHAEHWFAESGLESPGSAESLQDPGAKK